MQHVYFPNLARLSCLARLLCAGLAILACTPAEVLGTDSVVSGQPIPAGVHDAGRTEPVRARLKARHEATLHAATAGRIRQLPFREGDAFVKGDLLIALDCRVERAEAQYANTEYSVARKTLKTHKELRACNAISALDLSNSQAKMEMAEAKLELCKARLSGCEERAPFPGRIASLDVALHQRVNTGDRLMTILDPSVLDVDVRVPSQWLQWLRAGQTFTLTVIETGETVPAEVKKIGVQVDPVSRTVHLIGEIQSPVTSILPGMSGDAVFRLPQND